jgi:hypothetical protein
MLPVRIGETPIPILECRNEGPAIRKIAIIHTDTLVKFLRLGNLALLVLVFFSITGRYGLSAKTFQPLTRLVLSLFD